MLKKGLAAFATLLLGALLAGCGGGSGRQGTDVAVSASGPTEQLAGGSTATFVMTVRNAGGNTASDITLTNVLSNQLVPVSVECTASGGATCPAEPSLIMTVPSLPGGGALELKVNVQLTANASGTVSNTISANLSDDTDRTNNTASFSATAFSASSNLVVTGTSPGGTVTGGGTADFSVTVRNDGPDAAANLSLVNNTGSFVVLRSVQCAATGGGTCPATLGANMTLDTLPAGAALTFTVSTTVSAGVNGTVTNTFSANADTDTSRSDNTFTGSATVVTPQTGVFVTGVGPGGTVTGGSTVQFTMTVGNAGPDAATDVSIVNNVSNLTFTGVTCAATGGATCPTALGPVMTAASMPAASQLVFTVSAAVPANANGTLVNSMTATAANDTDRTDNTGTATVVAATPRATLALTGTAPSGQVAGGQTAVFTMTVTNSGPDSATNLRLTQTVGSNLTFTGATCTATAPAVCPATVGVVTTVPTLAAGGKLSFAVSALVAAGTNGSITNTMQAVADNASGSSVVAVGDAFTARSSLSVTGSGPSNVPAGTSAAFVMSVKNDGPDVAGSVSLVDTVGGNLTLTSVTCRSLAGGAVCPATPGATMTLTDLPVGGQLEFTVNATVALGTQGSILNTLTASVTTGTRSQTSAVATGTAYAHNVSASGSAPSGPLLGGQTGVFTMTVANSGPGTALDVAVDLVLGSGLSSGGAIGCSGTGVSCPATPGASMTIPSLPSGASLVFTVPATVVAGTNGTVGVTATATAAGDSRATDNSATASVGAASPDLSVSQSGATTVTAGGTAVFTAVVANPASTAAVNLALTSTLTATDTLVDLAGASIVCTAGAGATCPAATGPSMTVASLPAGRSLTFTITLPVAAAARGTVRNVFAVSAAGDPITTNNSATTTTTVIDPRNGSYKAFAADGRQYTLTIDFDARSYTMASATLNQQRTFTADASGGGFTVAGAQRLRTATDVVVGAHDFGAGALPYVAARSFGSSVSETVGSYNLVTRDFPGNVAKTHAGVVSIVGNQMLICQTDDGSIRAPGDGCTNAGKQRNFTLAAGANNVYTATEVGGAAEVFSFMLARSDASKFIVAAPTSDTATPVLRIALQDAASLIGGTFKGGSTSGSWIDPLTISGSTVSIAGGTADNGSITIATVSGTGVGAMKVGNRNGDAAQRMWVMQSAPLALSFGDFTASGSVAGLLQITVP